MGCLALLPQPLGTKLQLWWFHSLSTQWAVCSVMPSGGGDEMERQLQHQMGLKCWDDNSVELLVILTTLCSMLKLQPKASCSALRERKCDCRLKKHGHYRWRFDRRAMSQWTTKIPSDIKGFFYPAFSTLQSANQQVWQANCREITQQHEYMHFPPTPYVNYEKVFSVGFRI